MAMVLTEEQTLLRDSAKEFFKETAPVAEFRKLRDEKDEKGFSPELWSSMVEMGWAGIDIPEEYGGLDFGFQGLSIVLEESGRTLTASPLVATVLLGATALVLGGSEEQKTKYLPQVAEGALLMSAAVDEGPHFGPANTALEAKAEGDAYLLSGVKTSVLDGHVADQIVVLARTSGAAGDEKGLTLFLVDGAADGLKREKLSMVDSRNIAQLTFAKVKVAASDVIGEVGEGLALIEAVLDRAAIGQAAEMLGGMSQVFETTLEYLKERRQFGQLIGSFQALQHRAAQMFSEIEMTKSVIMEAASAVDEKADNLSSLASLAKARANQTYNLVTREGVQMHGGIGMTDEHDVGLYLKRARVAEHLFGNASYHSNRYANLAGF